MTVSLIHLEQAFAIEPSEASQKLVGVLSELLTKGEEREKCLSAQILGKFGSKDAQAALEAALRDDDADVRSDAIEAIVHSKTGLSADVLIWSLINDPVLEVKLAAVEGLALVGGAQAIDLLSKLAKDRCEDDVEWEGYGAEWDDWLDVQRKSILALGTLQCAEAIPAILEGARDPYGQEVWPEVTVALSEMSVAGLLELATLAEDPSARLREHVARSLLKVEDARAGAVLRVLFADADPDVRVAAAEVLMERGEEADLDTLLADNDLQMRRLALKSKAVLSQSKLETVAFGDPEETLRVMALERLAAMELSNPAGFVEQVERTLRGASAAFIAGVVPVLGTINSDDTEEMLSEIAEHRSEQPVIKAFLQLHGKKPSAVGLEYLQGHVVNAEQELRLAALASLAQLAEGEGDIADNAAVQMAWAISGKLLPEAHEQDILDSAKEKDPSALGSGKGQDKPPRIQLDREGNIIERRVEEVASEGEGVEADLASETELEGAIENPEDLPDNVVAFPGSTLGAILNTDEELEKIAEEPVELGQKDIHFLELANEHIEKKRVVPGRPKDPALDIRLLALRISGETKRPEMVEALITALADREMQVRFAAGQSLVHLINSGYVLSEEQIDRLLDLQPEADAAIKTMRVELLGTSDKDEALEVVRKALRDKSEAVASAALKALVSKEASEVDLRKYLAVDRRRLRATALELAGVAGLPDALDDVFEAGRMDNGVLIYQSAQCLRYYAQPDVFAGFDRWLDGNLSQKLAALEVLNKYTA